MSAAVKRGAVTVSVGDNGIEYFHFPSVTHGSRESIRSQQELSRGKATTTEAYSTVASVADTLDWALVLPGGGSDSSQALWGNTRAEPGRSDKVWGGALIASGGAGPIRCRSRAEPGRRSPLV